MSTVELPLKKIGRKGEFTSMGEFFTPYPSLEEVLRGQQLQRKQLEATQGTDSQAEITKTDGK